jgi:hypothetical protein
VRINDHNLLSTLVTGSTLLLIVLALAGLAFVSIVFALSILTGGVLALINFYFLSSAMKRILSMEGGNAGRYAQIRFMLRMLLLGLIVYGLLVYTRIDALGLIIGLSILAVGIVVLALARLNLKEDNPP